MKLERKHLLVVGIVLLVAFHTVLLFSPIIPVKESYLDIAVVSDIDEWRLGSDASLLDVDADGKFDYLLSSQSIPQDYTFLRTRTVYKSIVELLFG